MESSCLFCLEPIREAFPPNPIGCPCKIQAHKQCFDAWFVQKNQMECPICHTVSVPNQILQDQVHIVYVQAPDLQPRQRIETQQKKAVIFCCFLIFGWSIGMTILDLIMRA
jgi:hypothetical protein